MGNLFYKLTGSGLLVAIAIALQPPVAAQTTQQTTFGEAEAFSTAYGSRRRQQTYLGGTGRRQIL